jgi:hypothetical protein
MAEQFALSAPIGTACLYFPTKPFDRSKAVSTKIRSAPWVLGHGAVVVAVETIRGGVSIEHIAFDAPPLPERQRCPTCGEPVNTIFDHVDRNCEYG